MSSISIGCDGLTVARIAGQRSVQVAHDSSLLVERSVRAHHSTSICEEAAVFKKVFTSRQMLSHS